MTGNLFPQHSCRGSLEQTLWRRSPLQRLCSFWPRGFGGRRTEANGGSRGLLTDRWVPWWGGVMWTDRAQSPDQQCHCTPESSHLEGGKWPASSDSQQRSRRGALAPGSWETPWQRAELQTILWCERPSGERLSTLFAFHHLS